MLEDRYYMRRSPFDTQRSATMLLLVANVVAFLGECIVYGYPPGSHIAWGDKFALSWEGLSHGYVWQLLTFQFMHAGLLHLLFNCWAIFVFGREVEATLGVRRFLTLYFASGAIGGLVQTLAGGLAVNFFSTSQWAMRFAGPTLGASAGALGLLAAFAMLFPERHWPSLRRGPRPVPRRLVRVRSGNAAAWARSKPPAAEDLPPEEFLSKEVDPILDKISAQGIQSLTERERRILQAARDKMGKR
jgi:membrane associated rhomboid family serine protease